MADLLPVVDAQSRMLAEVSPLEQEQVSIQVSCGRVLYQHIVSDIDLPPFSNSSMDGFAVLASDVAGIDRQNPVTLKVVADIPAGSSVQSIQVKTGEGARIMTGAPLPAGADAVVPVEDTNHYQAANVDRERVTIFRPAAPGGSIRMIGQDIRKGDNILSCGRRLQPQDVGMLASLGYDRVPVFRKPKIGLLTSGDELVEPGQPLAPGKIYNSNSYMLSALIEQNGCEVFQIGVASDNEAIIREKLETAVSNSVDLILTSAGVSVGEYDYVRKVIEQNGKLNFWRVNMRPGKPVTFGRFHDTVLIGLPGNPVSTFITFKVFVQPLIHRMAGLPDVRRNLVQAELREDIYADGRESYFRAVLQEDEGKYYVSLTGHQGSGNLFSLVRASALAIIPAGVEYLPAGSRVAAWQLEEF